MGKSFKDNRPINNLTAPAPAEEFKTVTVEPSEPKIRKTTPAKRQVGRPKTKDVKGTCKNINVAVPITLLDKWEEVKIVHGSNLTDYITKLIEKDMDSNYAKYKSIADSLKNI
jgi:hypothetical protein